MTGEQRGKKWEGGNGTGGRTAARDARFAERRAARQTRPNVQRDDLFCKELTELMQFVIEKGGAVRIGATRDGGAWAIGIYGFGEPFTEYCGGDEDFAQFCAGLHGDLAGIA